MYLNLSAEDSKIMTKIIMIIINDDDDVTTQ